MPVLTVTANVAEPTLCARQHRPHALRRHQTGGGVPCPHTSNLRLATAACSNTLSTAKSRCLCPLTAHAHSLECPFSSYSGKIVSPRSDVPFSELSSLARPKKRPLFWAPHLSLDAELPEWVSVSSPSTAVDRGWHRAGS